MLTRRLFFFASETYFRKHEHFQISGKVGSGSIGRQPEEEDSRQQRAYTRLHEGFERNPNNSPEFCILHL